MAPFTIAYKVRMKEVCLDIFDNSANKMRMKSARQFVLLSRVQELGKWEREAP